MSRNGVFGTACKNCRRLGRKCDRTLPACMRCNRMGVVCEGYVLRWVGTAARGPLAVPVNSDTSSSDTHVAYSRKTRQSNKSGMTKFNNDKMSSTSSLTKPATIVPQLDYVVTSSFESILDDYSTNARAGTMLQEKDRRHVTTLKSSSLEPPVEVGSSNDNLGALITYC
jgi:hypothetical protein